VLLELDDAAAPKAACPHHPQTVPRVR